MTSVFPLCFCLCAVAQNLNQTVSITNTYLTGSEGEDKLYVPVALPDSLTKFNYKFDYSVFETPYKGAFEFSPYSIKMIPDPTVQDVRDLYLRAGAGYGLYPQFQGAWTPVRSRNFTLDVHQDFHGYAGRYRTVYKALDENSMLSYKDRGYDGLDLYEKFGIGGKLDSDKFSAGFDLSYNGIYNKDEFFAPNFFNSVTAVLGAASGSGGGSKVKYDASLVVDLAFDALDHNFEKNNVTQKSFDLSGTVIPQVSRAFGLEIDARLRYVNYGNAFDFAYTYLGYALAPHVVLNLGPFDLKAGVRVDGTDKLCIAPDVTASIVLADKVKIIAGVTGGTVFNSYSEMRRSRHWFCPGYSESLRNSRELVNASIGFEGSVASRLQFRLKGGVAVVEDTPLWGVKRLSSRELRPLLSFVDCKYAYADLSLVWKSPRFDADGSLEFRKTNLNGESYAFDMPLVSGSLRASYNWNRRIFAGAKINASTESRALLGNVNLRLPAYIDLGLFGEYRINRRWSVWVEGSNLLNEAIQITPMHVENGINGTLGVTFCL